METKAISIDAYAKAHYSEAEYSERLMLTADDFIKYFCSGETIDTDARLIEEMHKKLDDLDITVYELDGKFSEVSADITVDAWTEDDLIEYYDGSDDDDEEKIIEALAEKLEIKYSDQAEFAKTIKDNMEALVNTLDFKESITVSVPRSKVAELRAFVDKLNNKEVEQ